MSIASIKSISNNSKVLESIGTVLFEAYIKEARSMDNLIVGCSGFMNFFYSKKRLLVLKKSLEDALIDRESIRKPFIKRKSDEEIAVMLQKTNKLLLDYEKYLQEKREIRAFRKASRNNP